MFQATNGLIQWFVLYIAHPVQEINTHHAKHYAFSRLNHGYNRSSPIVFKCIIFIAGCLPQRQLCWIY